MKTRVWGHRCASCLDRHCYSNEIVGDAWLDCWPERTIVEHEMTKHIVKCSVADNGLAPEPVRRGRGLTIVGELASSLGSRVQTTCTAEGYSFLLTFPLNEAEQRAAGASHIAKLKRRKMRHPQRLLASRTEDLRTG
jgi:hypothetical protein